MRILNKKPQVMANKEGAYMFERKEVIGFRELEEMSDIWARELVRSRSSHEDRKSWKKI